MVDKQLNYLFVTWEGGGNTPPVFELARRLADRGHHVRILTEPCQQELAESYGLEFIPFKRHFTRTDRTEIFVDDSKATPSHNPAFDKVFFGPTEIVAEETLLVLQAHPTDVLVGDFMMSGSYIAAEALGIPTVALFHVPEILPGPNVPPGIMALKPGKGLLIRFRDRFLTRMFEKTLNKYLPVVNSVRVKYELPPVKTLIDIFHRVDLRFLQTCEAFDFPIKPAPANVRYVGAELGDPDWVDTWENPWPAHDNRPLVIVGLSTTFQNQRAVIERCIEALGTLEVRGLITLGQYMAKEKVQTPDNVVVLDSVSHAQIFPHADVVVTHAGHGTVMRALAHGLPLVCMPMGRDQDGNARKVTHHGLGLKLDSKAKAGKISKAISTILRDPSYAKNVRTMQQHILADARNHIDIKELEAFKSAGKIHQPV